MHLQLQIVKGHKSSGKCFWYIGQPLEALSLPHLFKSCNVTTVGKATVVLHNILTLPNDEVHTDVVDNRAEIHEDAFQYLAKQGN